MEKVVVQTGAKTYQITDQDGNDLGVFRFIPSDAGILKRYKEAAAFFTGINDKIKDKDLLEKRLLNGNCSISGHLIRWRTLSVRNLLKCGLKPEKQESLLEKQKPIQSRNLLSMQRDRAAAMQKCFT